MTAHWYALHVKPHKERSVLELLEARAVESYYPALKVKPVNPRSRKERPFFPGYMFVQLDLAREGSRTLRWAEGTHGLVEFGGEPAIVPASLINELQERMRLLQLSGGFPQRSLSPGDRIRIVEGPMAGYEAVFDAHLTGQERVQVLLTILRSQPKRLQLEASQIERARHGR
jgi:transcription elongation factor/antiterminator RfaH